MNLLKVIPFFQLILDVLWAHKENKELKKENASLKRANKRLELEVRGRSVKPKAKK